MWNRAIELKPEEQIEGMKKLLHHYRVGYLHSFIEYCPLCVTVGHESCDKCVWVVAAGYKCASDPIGRLISIVLRYESVSNLRNNAPWLWRKYRIFRLTHWIKKQELKFQNRPL